VTTKLDPATRLVRSLKGEYYKLSEAAEMLGCPESTLRALIKEATEGGDIAGAPKQWLPFGKQRIYLYTPEDIERIRGVLATRVTVMAFDGTPTGRPPRYTSEERAVRTKLSARAWYYRNRIKRLEEEGATRKQVTEAKRKLRDIETELKRTEKP
jgi:hypothetical protein